VVFEESEDDSEVDEILEEDADERSGDEDICM